MKVLLAHKYFYRGGGTATYLFALIEELEKRGHQWVPFTVAYDQTEVDSYSQYFVSPPLGTDETHYNDMRFSPGAMLKLLGRATYSFEARSKALRLIDDARPDIAYIHNIYNYMSPSIIHACRRRRIPMVMRVPDYNLMCAELHFLRDGQVCTECLEHGYKRALRYSCLKGSRAATAARVASMYVHKWLRIYDNVDLFITPSAFMREMMIRAGYDAEKIVHLPSFYPRQISSDAEPSEDDYILYFGRLAPEKGIDILIRAMVRIDSSVRLVIAGADVDGTQARLEHLAGDCGLDNVRFVGRLDRVALDEMIEHCLFAVVPSRWYDNCPMATLESLAHGKPVIGSNIGGIPEQITDGCGLLFEPDDPEDLAEQMELLVDNPDLGRQMGQAAGERVRTAYSAALHCDRLLKIFSGLIGGNKRPLYGQIRPSDLTCPKVTAQWRGEPMSSTRNDLLEEQYRVEKKFAKRIKAASPPLRPKIVALAEETVASLDREIRGVSANEDLCWGATLRTARLIERIIGHGKSVIDVGCGTGLLVRHLASSQSEVVGIDICSSLIETASANSHHLDNADFLCTSVEEAPFAPNSFDVACSIAVLEHLHPEALPVHLSRIHSLLRPGGIFIGHTSNRLDGPHDVSRNFVPLGSAPEGLHLREYSKGELVRLLKAVGFREFRCTRWPARLYERLPFCPATKGALRIGLLCETLIERWCPIRLRPFAVHICCNGLLVCKKASI